MITLQISETERISESGDGYQIERRCRQAGQYTFRPVAYHGTFDDAVADAAQREIQSLRNDDLNEFHRAAEGIVATYKQILNRALESRQGTNDRRQVG